MQKCPPIEHHYTIPEDDLLEYKIANHMNLLYQQFLANYPKDRLKGCENYVRFVEEFTKFLNFLNERLQD